MGVLVIMVVIPAVAMGLFTVVLVLFIAIVSLLMLGLADTSKR